MSSYLPSERVLVRLIDATVGRRLLPPLNDAGGAVGPGHDPTVPLHVEVLLVREDGVAPEVQHLPTGPPSRRPSVRPSARGRAGCQAGRTTKHMYGLGEMGVYGGCGHSGR